MYKKETDKYNGRIVGLLTILSALILAGSLFIGTERLRYSKMQETLAAQVLRFHVIANSDSEKDQQLKTQVKEAVVDYFLKNMPENMEMQEAKDWVREHVDTIEEIGKEVLREKGINTSVHGAVITCYFSDRQINGIVFPAGNYETLRLEIGKAKGHNWWCVLYPKFGFMDAVNPQENVTVNSNFKIRWYIWEKLKR